MQAHHHQHHDTPPERPTGPRRGASSCPRAPRPAPTTQTRPAAHSRYPSPRPRAPGPTLLGLPRRGWRIQAIAIGPGGITMTNPTTSPTSSAVPMARWCSQQEGVRGEGLALAVHERRPSSSPSPRWCCRPRDHEAYRAGRGLRWSGYRHQASSSPQGDGRPCCGCTLQTTYD